MERKIGLFLQNDRAVFIYGDLSVLLKLQPHPADRQKHAVFALFKGAVRLLRQQRMVFVKDFAVRKRLKADRVFVTRRHSDQFVRS